jgi:hypothetical protein
MVRRTFTLPADQAEAIAECSSSLGVSASALISHLLSGNEFLLREVAEIYRAPDAPPLSNRGQSREIVRKRVAEAMRHVGL